MKNFEDPSSEDLKVIERQLGRPPRNVLKIAHRCECGAPAVITTAPRLSDGTPFPTYFYATCPKLTGALSTLESAGLMTQFNQELSTDFNLREHLKTAHDRYLQARDLAMKNLAETYDDENHELKNISAGGMPDRIKCLHAIAAQSFAQGVGVNKLGDRTIAALPKWWCEAPCSSASES